MFFTSVQGIDVPWSNQQAPGWTSRLAECVFLACLLRLLLGCNCQGSSSREWSGGRVRMLFGGIRASLLPWEQEVRPLLNGYKG